MKLKQLLMHIVRPINIPITRLILNRHYRDSKELSSTKNAKRILILAPHMDDETIGPGGVLKKHANEGAEIHCAFITDGSNSESKLSKEDLKHVRMNEMEEVKKILGIHSIHYMGLPDGDVVNNEESRNKFHHVIQSVQPDMIYCTSFVDAHPDHTHTAAILADVLKQMRQRDYIIRLYEINCPIPPMAVNCVIDISDTMQDKRQAIEIFASQTIAFDGFLELNKAKANLVSENVAAVEVFMEPSMELFIRHCDNLKKENYPFPHLFKQANRTDTLLWAIYKNFNLKQKMYTDSLNEK